MTARRVDFAELDVELRLHGPCGWLEASLRGLTIVRDVDVDADVVECIADLVLDLAAYRVVDEQRLFHLDREVRGAGHTFAPDGAVEIEVRLEHELVPALVDASSTPQEAGLRLGALSGGPTLSPLLSSEAWYALAVRAPAERREQIAEDGLPQAGSSTRWASADGQPERGSMLALVARVLQTRGWQQEPDEDIDVLRWRMSDAAGSWTSYALAREADERLSIYSVLDVTFAEDRVREGALLVTRVNQGLPFGNWELDLTTGVIRYKTSMELAGAPLSLAQTSLLIERNLEVVDSYLDAFCGFAVNGLTVDQALALSEG